VHLHLHVYVREKENDFNTSINSLFSKKAEESCAPLVHEAVRCLTYLPGPCDKKILCIGTVSVTASDARKQEKETRKKKENFETRPSYIDISYSVCVRYLRRSSVFRVSFLQICRTISPTSVTATFLLQL